MNRWERKLFLTAAAADEIDGVDDAGQVAEQSQDDVQQQLLTQAPVKKNAHRWQQNGEDDFDDVIHEKPFVL